MVVWFITIAVLGIGSIVQRPGVFAAVIPTHAISFIARKWPGRLQGHGAVFLVVTGGEALYADLGHFGARPIRRAWFGLVFPALLVNYLGQGALLLRDRPRPRTRSFSWRRLGRCTRSSHSRPWPR
jgi:KUP system potassium uptake protein